ncbi:helix-turn-helix domain-containing protein [Sulfurovum sp.]|uniref:helix-turn-helix domain-containing protein n=1 Tax=Sulfurovum sp. TaxID=1969726 RepID=UPI002867EE66|nr:helix-turn-helix domain-containing protein [Sulfurovum sp.]
MKQNTALDILKSGKNVFITGSAGTGKTYLLNLYTQYLNARRVYPTIVAPTGIAASHLGGQTIHSFFSLGIRESIDEGYVDFLLEKKYLKTRFSKLKILIIDEVSMISPELFSSMDMILRGFKGTDAPFGGVQVVISGDFFQLPPISKVPKEKRFAWQSPAWKALDLQTCYLQEKFRQDDDRLIQILDDIRSGEISVSSEELLASRHEKELGTDTPTKLYTHNVDVDRINLDELNKLEGEAKLFVYESKGSEKNIEKIFKSSLVLEELALKKGAVVIFIKNNAEAGYVNGTTGIVRSFSPIDNMPIVRTTDGRKIKLDLEDWSLENDSGKVTASVSQVPLRLAWAITIHKSQGMTLDAAEIDLSKTFETGQGYVALSRIKNIEGLRLMGLNPMALRVDPLILHIDERIIMASKRAADSIEILNDESLKKVFESHVSALGGIVCKEKIDEEIQNIKEGKPSHSAYVTPTYKKTQNLIEKSDTLVKLAINRGLGKSTIVQHLARIKEENPDIDINKYKPKDELFERVDDVVLKLKTKNFKENFSEDGTLRLKPIYEALGGEVSYDELRVCMLFVE